MRNGPKRLSQIRKIAVEKCYEKKSILYYESIEKIYWWRLCDIGKNE